MTKISLYSQSYESELYEKISNYTKDSNDKSLSIEKRFFNARKAIELSILTKNDSTILESNRVLSHLFVINGDYDSLYKINYDNFKLSTKLKDTLKLGYATNNLAFYYDNLSKFDSAYYYYYKARKFYNLSKKKRSEAGVLKNMAYIQETERDFIGSEINAVKGIEILKGLDRNDDIYSLLWFFHNLIAIISDQIERYDRAIEYHNKAVSYSIKINEVNNLDLYSNTNIAILNRRKGNFTEAISKILLILKDKSIKKEEPETYSSLISNLAYSRLSNNNYNINELDLLFRESISSAKRSEDKLQIVTAYEYFSEYFLKIGNKDSAYYYTDKAYKIAKKNNINNSILNTLLLKSKINDGEEAKKNLQEYIKLNDSLLLAERAIRNKFARIEYETEEVKLENLEVKEANLQITKQRLWLLLVTGILAITLFLLYIIKTQRERNKELELAQKQQEFNEEIYNLMLSQQEKVDQGRTQEKKQISQELHDGVLGRLFGVRLSLDSLNFSKTDEAIETRGNYIEELQAIEQDIRKVSHELNTDFVTSSGYFDIVKALVDKQTNAYNLEYSLEENNDINWESLTNKVKMHCYRIIQESLQNIYKHAKGSRVDISFEQLEDQFKLIIKDDGAGFDLEKAKKGIGLKNMYARVKEIQGELKINTKLNKGTTLTIQVPN